MWLRGSANMGAEPPEELFRTQLDTHACSDVGGDGVKLLVQRRPGRAAQDGRVQPKEQTLAWRPLLLRRQPQHRRIPYVHSVQQQPRY